MMRGSDVWGNAASAAVVFGIICRLSQYAADTSLWHDEAFVALNVVQKSYAGLLGPLDWHEAAPPGFLLLEKVVVESLGRSEYSLRLVPFVAGLAGLICFAALARTVCSSAAAACWAVVLMAASDKLIAQANEAKQFTFDLLFAVLLSQLALRVWHERGTIAAHLTWGVVGACAVWLSFASAFVFAGTSLVMVWRIGRPQRAAYLIANLMVLTSLAFLFVSIQAQLSGELLSFWTPSFPDTSGIPALIYWLGRSLVGLFNYFWQPLGVVLILLAALGSASAWRAELLVLVVPVVLALLASSLHRWPFGGNQHMVFAGAAILVLVGEGLEGVRIRLSEWRWLAGTACVALVLVPGVVQAAYRIAAPRQRHEIRPVIAFVQQHEQPGDQLLVLCPAEFEFYTGRNVRSGVTPDPALRVWFIATRADGRPFPHQDVLDRLSTRRRRLLAINERGAAAYLFGPERKRSEE